MQTLDKNIGPKTLKIKDSDLLGYLERLVRVQSALLDVEENRLRKSEVRFFALLCYLKYLGYDIEDHKSLMKGLEEIGEPMKSTTVSQYKTRLSIKTWIQSGLNKLKLPSRYDIAKTGTSFSLQLWYEEKSQNNENQTQNQFSDTGRDI